MSDANNSTHAAELTDLARSLYVNLVTEAVQFKEQGLSMSASPENLVQLSYKLAEAFNKVAQERAVAAKPKASTLDLGKIDFGV